MHQPDDPGVQTHTLDELAEMELPAGRLRPAPPGVADYDTRADEYYDRQTQHREEILPYLVAVFLGAIACGGVVFAWTVVT